MAFAPSKSNTSRLVAALLAVFAVALIAGASQASAADRGWTPTGDLQNVYLQVHNGLIAPDDSSGEQFQVSVVNYNNFAVNGKIALYAVKGGKPKGKAVAEGGFQLPAGGPTTAILLSSDKLTKQLTGKKFKGLKVRAKVAFWTNGFTSLGKAEGNYNIVKKLKGAKGAANTLPTAASLNYTVKEGSTLSIPTYGLLSGATDADFDHVYLRVVKRPANGRIFTIAANGLFTYAGTANWAGTDSFVFDIFDGTGYSAPVTVNLKVTPIAPKIATIADQKVNGGDQPVQTIATKSFVTGSPTISYELTGTPPAGATINASTGVITIPVNPTAGTYSVSLKATNPGGSTTKAFKIIVKPGKVGTISDQSTVEDAPVSFATAGYFTAAAGATYSATGLPDGLSINTATGEITGTSPDPDNFNDVAVTVTDANGTATQTFDWEIQLD